VKAALVVRILEERPFKPWHIVCAIH
jgi:hypothetical protein